MKKSFICTVILILGCLMVVWVMASFIASAQEAQGIKPEELKKLIEAKADIVVVDNQPKSAYDMGHIPGAINFPWQRPIKVPVNLPRNKLLILYCACSHEEDSIDVADQIKEFGYNNIILLEGGWLRWVELGYPIEKK
jgi:rhodanese-related sulfurtransferase